MADHFIDAGAGSGVAAGVARAAGGRGRVHAQGSILAPGESAAHPPGDDAHWSLRLRLGVLIGLALLSWAFVGGVAAVLIRL